MGCHCSSEAPSNFPCRPLPPYVEEKTKAEREGQWDTLKKQFPYHKTPEETAQRDALIASIDTNKDGTFTVETLKIWASHYTALPKFTNNVDGLCIAAYNAMKKAYRCEVDDGIIKNGQFRAILMYFYTFCELSNLGDTLVTAKPDEMTFAEFQSSIPKMKEWGINFEDPKATYDYLKKGKANDVNKFTMCEYVAEQKVLALGVDK